ncbi:hypothetical protein FVEG_07403 [Fusarium verticillioides 7600]|uniref:Uncharacterized protein n=1 Tax=Gibberella moniliformis (strain M3125 / FGSC 7600) TaxID=334819 RepID=W7M6M2_GIBM7|nr:hypothetical protein FVEG_07403 [Fusarium verticillioides 7600]EWG47238.1 hypothetical protein FVEG_07403 [Fusarium verticillioides 7600]
MNCKSVHQPPSRPKVLEAPSTIGCAIRPDDSSNGDLKINH